MFYKIFRKFFPEKVTGRKDTTPKNSAYLNGMVGIKVISYAGKTLIEMPLSFLVHTHLKDYGFDPDSMTKYSPQIVLMFNDSPDKWVKIPLYIKNPNGPGYDLRKS